MCLEVTHVDRTSSLLISSQDLTKSPNYCGVFYLTSFPRLNLLRSLSNSYQVNLIAKCFFWNHLPTQLHTCFTCGQSFLNVQFCDPKWNHYLQ
uniref:Ovule protein n=1 Tax=Heterorhabditis bacteriophora TaxID=37862 RepID=A0A1I7WBG0_HETBA